MSIEDNTGEEYLQWFRDNRFVFHWTVKGGTVEIISIFVDMPTRKDAIRLCSALRRRGMDVSYFNHTLSLRSRCSLEMFLDVLRKLNIDWDEFKTWVSSLYFNQSTQKHVPDWSL